MNLPEHFDRVPALYRRRPGPSQFPGVLPDNNGCKIRIGATYSPAIKIEAAVHTPDANRWEPASNLEQTIWGCGLIGGFFSFIFVTHLIFGA